MALDPEYLDAIKKSEGYAPTASWEVCLDVVPILATANNRNLRLPNAKLFRQIDLPNPTRCSDSADIIFRKLGHPVPSLRSHVVGVVAVGAQKEVFRVDACAIVAAMTNEHSLWDRA